jgi:hypothetical protein
MREDCRRFYRIATDAGEITSVSVKKFYNPCDGNESLLRPGIAFFRHSMNLEGNA